MIIVFHALFLVTRYLISAISRTVFRPQNRGGEPVENKTQNFDVVLQEKVNVVSEACFSETGNPTFYPPVYVQRYLAVKSVLEDERWNGKIRKIVDFGCAEFGLFPYLKHVPGLQEILTVDIDGDLLDQYKCRVAPLNSDFLKCREEPLEVQVLAGSISDLDECLLGCDAVICIELIEHLYPDTLEHVPYTVFGFIKPLVAVFTTPNSEFNVIFPGDNTGFRHWDHKFEWTREQFECWANNIVQRYPDYKVCFRAVGPGPPGTEAVGTCSQMALFVKNTLHSPGVSEVKESTGNIQRTGACQKYKLVHQYSYPHRVDTRTNEMKLRDEAEYFIRTMSTCERYMKEDRAEIPLAAILPAVESWTNSMPKLRKILEEAGYKMFEEDPDNVAVIYPWHSDSSMSSNQSEPCDVFDWGEEPTDGTVEEDWDLEPVETNHSAGASWYTLETCSLNKLNGSGWGSEEHSTRGSTGNIPKPVTDPSIGVQISCSHTETCSPASDTSRSANQTTEFERSDVLTYNHHETDLGVACGIDLNVGKHCGVVSELSSNSWSDIDMHNPNAHNVFLDPPKHTTKVPFLVDMTAVAPQTNLVEECCKMSMTQTDCNLSSISKHSVQNREALPKCASLLSQEVESIQSIDTKETQTAFDDLNCSRKVLNSFQDSVLSTVSKITSPTDRLERQGLPIGTTVKDSPTHALCLNLQPEVPRDGIVAVAHRRVEVDRLTDSPMVDSVSLDEPNDKLADSGYPNSASAQDMDMDLTPEQVDEIFTENDVLTDNSNEDSDSLSVSSGEGDSDSMDDDDMRFRPIYVPRNEMLFEAMNVENGDVANNNRDGEGNNAVAVVPLPRVAAHQPRNLEEDLIPLLEAAEDLDNDNEVRLPEHVEPFPHWLLNLLGLANHGGGDAVNFGPALLEDDSEDEDNPLLPAVADEGIGDEFSPESSNTDTAASEHGSDEGLDSDSDVDVLALDPPQEAILPGDMGAGGEPSIFRGGAPE